LEKVDIQLFCMRNNWGLLGRRPEVKPVPSRAFSLCHFPYGSIVTSASSQSRTLAIAGRSGLSAGVTM